MNELEQMYQEIILDAARDRHGEGAAGRPRLANLFQVNPTCGDQVTMQVNIEDGKIALAWDGHGCFDFAGFHFGHVRTRRR